MSHEAYIFDDRVADGFAPFALTRPCGELLYGRWSVRQRIERAVGARVRGHVTRNWLARYTEPGAPPVTDVTAISTDSPRLFWSSRAIADPTKASDAPTNLWVGESLAGVTVEAGAEAPDRAWFSRPSPLPDARDVTLDGEWLTAPWDLVSGGADRLRLDLEGHLDGQLDQTPPGVHRLGDAPFVLGDGATVEPGCLVDTRRGGVELGAGVEVRTGTRLQGPIYAGDRSKLLGGSVSGLAAGPSSYLRGELEEVITFGYCNKAHDGFLGHAVLGAWVNLGAMTTNSDLKNNYGNVRVGPPGDAVDTGLTKLGSLIGDHVKTGIGVLLNTGTVLGAGSNIFGAELPPKWVPPFSWGQGAELSGYRREAFLKTAAIVLTRRGVDADEDTLSWLAAAWDEACG
ncbi:MAG: putative sugar nucleotidyl transferase [Gemmatimonadota bacterium]